MSPRYQRGDVVRQELALPIMPTRPPVATVAPPAPMPPFAVQMAIVPFAGPNTFAFAYHAFEAAPLGIYSVTVSYLDSEGGSHALEPFSFEIVPGGDSGGDVIAIFGCNRPEAPYCLAQLSSGRLVQGRNPRL